MKILLRILVATAVITVGIYAQHHHGAPDTPVSEKSEKTELIDEFGRLGHCDLTARFDNLFSELSEQPDSTGYVIVYNAADALPANYADAPMGRVFQNHMAFRNFDASRVVVVDGGFQAEPHTELWIVPPGGEKPEPRNTVKPPVMPTDRTFLFDLSPLMTDDSGLSVEEFELPSVRAAREAEMARMEAEYAAENPPDDAAEDADESASENADPGTEQVAEEYVDTRTPEEIEADRFSWVSTKFGEQLLKRKNSTGVMILYVDDQTYNVERLRQFIEQGKKRLADAAGISVARISVVFGGYRDFPEVECWIVPPKGRAPTATPRERPVEEPADAESTGN